MSEKDNILGNITPLRGEFDAGCISHKDIGTRLTCYITDYEGRVTFCEVGNSAWDNDLDGMMGLVRSLLIGVGFSEHAVDEHLNGENDGPMVGM